MKLARHMVYTALAVMVVGIAACGGGGSTGFSSTSVPGKYVRGAITAFGSVYVNGVRYDTSNANVYIEGDRSSEDNLQVGMMVTVKESSNGVASEVHFGDEVEGFVVSNDLGSGGALNVMGQNVTITATTVFENNVTAAATPADIETGSIVEVSGNSSGTGIITATRIEVKVAPADVAAYLAAGNLVEVKGIVAGHSDGSKTFTIGNLTVAYESANILDMPAPAGSNWNGIFVEAKSGSALNGNTMLATKVEPENDGTMGVEGEDEDEMEVKGEVSLIKDTSIVVGGQTFLIDDNTEFRDIARQNLIVGMYVEAAGRFNANGDLVAKKVKLEDMSEGTEANGAVTLIESTDTNAGTVTVGGVAYTINNNTIMQDNTNTVSNFNLSHLQVGDNVEIHHVDGVAVKLERKVLAPVPVE